VALKNAGSCAICARVMHPLASSDTLGTMHYRTMRPSTRVRAKREAGRKGIPDGSSPILPLSRSCSTTRVFCETYSKVRDSNVLRTNFAAEADELCSRGSNSLLSPPPWRGCKSLSKFVGEESPGHGGENVVINSSSLYRYVVVSSPPYSRVPREFSREIT